MKAVEKGTDPHLYFSQIQKSRFSCDADNYWGGGGSLKCMTDKRLSFDDIKYHYLLKMH